MQDKTTKWRRPKGHGNTLDKSINVQLKWTKQIKMTNSELLFRFSLFFAFEFIIIVVGQVWQVLIWSRGENIYRGFIKEKRGGWLLVYWFTWSVVLYTWHLYDFLNKRIQTRTQTHKINNIPLNTYLFLCIINFGMDQIYWWSIPTYSSSSLIQIKGKIIFLIFFSKLLSFNVCFYLSFYIFLWLNNQQKKW